MKDTPGLRQEPPPRKRRPAAPLYDEDAERALVGALLITPAYVPDVRAVVRPEDLYVPELGRIYTAVVDLHDQGQAVNATTVAAALRSTNGTKQKILELQAACPAAVAIADYARIVTSHARQRRLRAACHELERALEQRDGTYDAERHLRAALDDTGAEIVLPGPDLEDFLAVEDSDHDWVVPGILERGERLCVTGLEGHGKSTLLRQVAIQIACGIHPFTLTDIPPARVTLVDLENSERHLRRQLRTLKAGAAGAYPAGGLRIEHRAEGIDLTEAAGRAWLSQHVAADRPDVLVIGPLYKMALGDPTSEEVARAVAFTLDHLRAAHRFALIVEAHVPYAASSRASRPERPYGASLWSRWPEFGVYLGKDGELRHWRGPRDEREWPVRLKRGGAWPWTVEETKAVVTFAEILAAQREADHKLTVREIEELTKIPRTSAARAIAANQAQWDALLEEMELTSAQLDL